MAAIAERTPPSRLTKDQTILRAVIPVFGRLGFRKAAMDDLAEAAGLSKQGLYLHFASKEEIFVAAMQNYLKEGLLLVDQALTQSNFPLADRLVGAMNAWFGRHLVTFTPEAFDVIEAGNHLSPEAIGSYKLAFCDRLAAAIKCSPEFDASRSAVSPKELAQVFFTFGLTWKDGRPSSTEFLKSLRLCVRACLPQSKRGRE